VTSVTCSCIGALPYWSSSTYANSPAGAWFVNFFGGFVMGVDKNSLFFARAVRGGCAKD
jgi:fluoride ion exporter CrcB/FEX